MIMENHQLAIAFTNKKLVTFRRGLARLGINPMPIVEVTIEPRKNPVWEKIRFGSGQKKLRFEPDRRPMAHSRH